MTKDELVRLAPYFDESERFVNGAPVLWDSISIDTMLHVRILREVLAAPIWLIRGAHPNRPSAIDGCCPAVPLAQIFMALTRLQRCSWGIYSGNSFHIDTREYHDVPARWLAVKLEERPQLEAAGLGHLVSDRRDGWLYLDYGQADSLAAVRVVCRLAERPRAAPAGV